jgi:hypothetical protein
MIYVGLRKRISDLLRSNVTLLWLEGTKYNLVNRVQLKGDKIVLSFNDGTIKLFQFEKYSFTAVGVQFWHQGRSGVLYQWDIPTAHGVGNNSVPEDDPTPPHIAA